MLAIQKIIRNLVNCLFNKAAILADGAHIGLSPLACKVRGKLMIAQIEFNSLFSRSIRFNLK